MYKEFRFTDGSALAAGTFYGIGKNYAKHAREMGGEVPAEPVIFIKPPATLIHSGDNIIYPPNTSLLHHELELVVVIGQDAVNVKKEDAAKYIAGYAVGLDMTLRDLQNKAKKAGEPWAVAKGFYTSGPVSDVVPASALQENPVFDLELFVNGELRQSGVTSDMERSVPMLIEYLSQVFTLRKGDCIFTGTPEGVGEVNIGDKLVARLKDLVSLEVGVVGQE